MTWEGTWRGQVDWRDQGDQVGNSDKLGGPIRGSG